MTKQKPTNSQSIFPKNIIGKLIDHSGSFSEQVYKSIYETSTNNFSILTNYFPHTLATIKQNGLIQFPECCILSLLLQLVSIIYQLFQKGYLPFPLHLRNFAVTDQLEVKLILNPDLLRIDEFRNKYADFSDSLPYLHFMPPEFFFQCRNHPESFASWIVGNLFFEFLTNVPLIKPKIPTKYGIIHTLFSIIGGPPDDILNKWIHSPDILFAISHKNY
jgi:hypothetical protein